MENLINSILNKKLLVRLVTILIVILGTVSLVNLNREAYPEVNFDMVTVTTIYRGASPEEIEQLISIPIEKKIRGVGGIDKVRSYNIENVSVIAIYLEENSSNRSAVVQDIKDAVALTEDLPENSDLPQVKEIKIDKTEVMFAAIYGVNESVPYDKIHATAKKLEKFIYEIDGIADVETYGMLDKEFLVEASPRNLKKYRIGTNHIIGTLMGRNLDMPGGSLKHNNDEYILRTKNQYETIQEIRDTIITANDTGDSLKIKDLAKVTATYKDPDVLERYKGKNSVVFSIWKKKSMDEIQLSDTIQESMKHFPNPHGEEVKVELFNLTSRFTQNTLSSVSSNAVTGFVLLALVLYLMLGLRVSAVVSLSIPLSFMIAFAGMQIMGLTMNVVSMFALIMVLGMIVDFGIVVSENGQRYMESGLSKRDAVIKGTSEVIWPVLVTLLCICAAFAPLLFVVGLMGKFVKAIPIVIMICLASSFVIAIFLLPSYLNAFMKEKSVTPKGKESLFDRLFGNVTGSYEWSLKFALKHRYVTLGILVVMLTGAVLMVPQVGFVFVPGGGSEQIELKTYLPQGRNLDSNKKGIQAIEDVIMKLPPLELEALHARVGLEDSDIFDPKPGEGTHKSTLMVYLSPEKDRSRKAREIAAELRSGIAAAQKSGALAQDMVVRIKVKEQGPPTGKPINVEIRGDDFEVLKKIAQEYMGHLKGVQGVSDVTADLEIGKEEYRFKINEPMAALSGLSAADTAKSLNTGYEGVIASSVIRGEEKINIRVRYPEASRRDINSLRNVMIANKRGGLISLDTVAYLQKTASYSGINRLNYKRVVQVQAAVDTTLTTSQAVNSQLADTFSEISTKYPGYSVSYGGENEDTAKAMDSLGKLFILALFVIFTIIAVYFNSVGQTIVIMSAIPFSLVGVILALLTHGEPLSFMSILGLFSLAGIIVSNSLVLVQFINMERKETSDLGTAIVRGSGLRLRPVILTTATTVLGLLPTIYGLGDKNYTIAPLALAFGYGLIFAAFITLILIPCLYHIVEDVNAGAGKLSERLKRGLKKQEEEEAA